MDTRRPGRDWISDCHGWEPSKYPTPTAIEFHTENRANVASVAVNFNGE